jgi:hypothetical protein
MGGQGDLQQMMTSARRLLKSAALVLVGVAGLWGGLASAAAQVERQTPAPAPATTTSCCSSTA